MPEPSPNRPPSAVCAQPWAARLGLALLAGIALILGLTIFDGAHRRQLEAVSETTAVGDTHYFQPPADASKLPAIGTILNGQPFYLFDVGKLAIRDTHTQRIGRDGEHGFSIYRLIGSATPEERKRAGADRGAFVLLKTDSDEFIVARGPGAK